MFQVIQRCCVITRIWWAGEIVMADQSESHFVRQCPLEMERENICGNLNAMEGKKKKDFTCSSPQKKKNKVLGIVLKWSCPFKRTWIWINTYARWLVQQRSEHTGATNSSGIKNVAVVQKEESREKQAWSITQELSCRYFSSVKIWWDLNTSQVLGN